MSRSWSRYACAGTDRRAERGHRAGPQPNRTRTLPERPAWDPEPPSEEAFNLGVWYRSPSIGLPPPQQWWQKPIPATLMSGDGRLLETWRWDLRRGNDSVQNAMLLVAPVATGKGMPVVAVCSRLPPRQGLASSIREEVRDYPLSPSNATALDRARTPMPRRNVVVVCVDQSGGASSRRWTVPDPRHPLGTTCGATLRSWRQKMDLNAHCREGARSSRTRSAHSRQGAGSQYPPARPDVEGRTNTIVLPKPSS